MALITLEGWENYSTFAAVKGVVNYSDAFASHSNAITLLTSADANSVSPRNSGSCLKLISAANNASAYSRVLLTHPTNADNTTGTIGFAWYNFLPSGRTAAVHYATFVPIAALVSSAGIPHFFIGVNSNNQIEIRRLIGSTTFAFTIPGWGNVNFTSNPSTYLWNQLFVNTEMCSKSGCVLTYPQFQASSYTLIGTASTNLCAENSWNFIEVQYSMSTTTSGFVRVKVNRAAGDATLDIDTTVANTVQGTLNVRSVMLGMGRGGQSTLYINQNNCENSTSNAQVYTQYYDDFYWCDATGSTYNTFLGRVSCAKFTYDTMVSSTYTTPSSGVTALSNINETFAGTGSMTTRNISNEAGQVLNVRSSGVGSQTLAPIFVRQYVHGYRTNTTADVALGAIDGADAIANSPVTLGTDSTNGGLKFRDYDNAPDGAEWTNAKIASTVFRHSSVQV
jgi:hypothetical protein